MSSDLAVERSLSPFFANKSISRVLRRLSSGKEAVVYCCEAGPALEGRELVAAKIYRPPERRAFRRHMEYADGRHVQGRTARAALKARNGYGQRLLFESWIQFEEQSLRRLHRRGVRVPESLGCQGYAILMEYLGDREAPAPLLHDVRLERSKAEWVLDELLYDVETMLADNLIHGDLSDFNVLLWAGEPFVIDLPQALDPRVNLRSELLLRRDIERLCQWGRRFGVERDADSFATELWIRWLEGEL